MFKATLALIAALILLADQPVPFQPLPTFKDAIVTVSWTGVDEDGEEIGARCTGFVVGIASVITAKHCLPSGKEQMYVEGHESRILKQNDAFGLLSIEPMSKPVLQIRKDRPDVGETVTSYGYAYGGPLMALKRSVAAFCGCHFAEQDHLIMDNPIIHGMSGGPVLDSKNRVVGLNQAATEDVGIACTAEEIKEFIDGK